MAELEEELRDKDEIIERHKEHANKLSQEVKNLKSVNEIDM